MRCPLFPKLNPIFYQQLSEKQLFRNPKDPGTDPEKFHGGGHALVWGLFFKNWGLIKQSVLFLVFIIHKVSEVFEKNIDRFWDWKCKKKKILRTNQFFPIFWKYLSPRFLRSIKKRPPVWMFEVSNYSGIR